MAWATALAHTAAGAHGHAFCALRRLQALDPAWPGLHAALQQAAAAEAAAAQARDEAGRASSSGSGGAQGAGHGAARALLGLPACGPLARAELARAYRRRAVLCHPDAAHTRRQGGGAGAGGAGAEEPSARGEVQGQPGTQREGTAAQRDGAHSVEGASEGFIALRAAYELLLQAATQ